MNEQAPQASVETVAGSRAKVFISYSRKDLPFAQSLVEELTERGFDAFLDKTDIAPGEPWKERLGGLIATADTVVFAISPDSVASTVCAWELEESARLGKRLIPLVARRIPDADAPPALGRLNWVFCTESDDKAAALTALDTALHTDLPWVREHTRLGELARHWDEQKRSRGATLRGADLDAAERWLDRRPADANAPTDLHQDFIRASRRAATMRQRYWVGGSLAVAIVAIGLAIFAEVQRQYAEQALDAAIRTSNSLSLDLATRLRNQRGIPSALVKYLFDQALRLQDQLNSYGRITPDLQRGEARALLESSLTLLTIGDNSGALAAADRARQIIEKLLAVRPDDPDWQLNLAVSYERVGDVLVAQGKREEALAAYRKAVAIAQRVVGGASTNTEAQGELAINYIKIGDVLAAQGKPDEALAAYQMSLAIRQKFVDWARGNAEWQRGLAISYERVGDVLLAQGKSDEALAAYQKRLAIAEEVAGRNSDNTEWQRDLSVAYNKVGDALLYAGKREEAISAYQKALVIRQKLADSDKGNAIWQRDVAISHNKIGEVMVALGQLDEALAAYQMGLAIEQELAIGDPANASWQRDLLLSDMAIGNVLNKEGKLDAALKAYRDSLVIAQGLAEAHPGEEEWKRALEYSIGQIGMLAYRFVLAHDFAKALEVAYQAIALAPDQIWLYTNKAHALMFLGRADEARTVYLQYRGTKNVQGEKSWETVILDDFADLRKAGLSNPLMDEIEKEFSSEG